jgi:hypothetical protein
MDETTQNIIINLILLIGCIWMLYSMQTPTKEQKEQKKKTNIFNKIIAEKYKEIMDLSKNKKF